MRNNYASAEHPPKQEAPPAAEAQEGSQAPALSAGIQEQQQAAVTLSLQSRYVPDGLLQTHSDRNLPGRLTLSEICQQLQPSLRAVPSPCCPLRASTL